MKIQSSSPESLVNQGTASWSCQGSSMRLFPHCVSVKHHLQRSDTVQFLSHNIRKCFRATSKSKCFTLVEFSWLPSSECPFFTPPCPSAVTLPDAFSRCLCILTLSIFQKFPILHQQAPIPLLSCLAFFFFSFLLMLPSEFILNVNKLSRDLSVLCYCSGTTWRPHRQETTPLCSYTGFVGLKVIMH